jgi:hypothetical protein
MFAVIRGRVPYGMDTTFFRVETVVLGIIFRVCKDVHSANMFNQRVIS